MRQLLYVFAVLTALVLGQAANAWVASSPVERKYDFKFQLKKAKKIEKYEVSLTAQTYEEAFQDAAQACFNHFKNGKRLSEDQGLDIIDACVNPYSI